MRLQSSQRAGRRQVTIDETLPIRNAESPQPSERGAAPLKSVFAHSKRVKIGINRLNTSQVIKMVQKRNVRISPFSMIKPISAVKEMPTVPSIQESVLALKNIKQKNFQLRAPQMITSENNLSRYSDVVATSACANKSKSNAKRDTNKWASRSRNQGFSRTEVVDIKVCEANELSRAAQTALELSKS